MAATRPPWGGGRPAWATPRAEVHGRGRAARPPRGNGGARERRPAMTGRKKTKPRPPGGAGQAPAAPGPPPPGLDAARHAAAQRSAHHADALRLTYAPAALATALGMGGLF